MSMITIQDVLRGFDILNFYIYKCSNPRDTPCITHNLVFRISRYTKIMEIYTCINIYLSSTLPT